jgi:hypothetical protein
VGKGKEVAQDPEERPTKCRALGRALDTMKKLVPGMEESGSGGSKDGAPPPSSFGLPINRAEVVISVKRRKPVHQEAVPIASMAPPSISSMAPPLSSSPSVSSFRSTGSRKRNRDSKYDFWKLRTELNASQEELSSVKRQYARYRGEAEAYIKSLHDERQDNSSEDEGGPSSKGKAHARRG